MSDPERYLILTMKAPESLSGRDLSSALDRVCDALWKGVETSGDVTDDSGQVLGRWKIGRRPAED